jgi:hypothetical protein
MLQHQRVSLAGVSAAAAFQDPPEASGWILTAARDFGATANFIRDARKHNQSSVDHIGLLVGALVTYARPFRGGQVISLTKSMQLACVFLLAEVNHPLR